ncbi:MAG: hypothetical protein ACRDFX_06095, partial [Chloroflexota bacterium]
TDDIERVQQIRRLIGELGVNLAGVEVILNMRDQMEAVRHDLELQIERMQQEHDLETRRLKDIIWRLQGVANETGQV